MSEQQTAPKKPLLQLISEHLSYPMLLIAIYAAFHVAGLLQLLAHFSIRGIFGFLCNLISAALPFGLLALLWLDRSGKLQKRGWLKIFLWVETVVMVYQVALRAINVFGVMDDLDMYTFIRSGLVGVIGDILVALLFVLLSVSLLQNKERPVFFRIMAVLTICYHLFFGIVQQLTGSGDLFGAFLDAIFVIALFYLPQLLQDARSVEITAERGKILRAIIIVTLIVAVISGIAVGGNSGGGSSSGSTNTCGSCHRSWSAGDSGGNYMSIARTNMCKNCYNNFKWAQDALGR